MHNGTHPIFLLGAGFDADAEPEVGPVDGESICYPLVEDLARICFDRPSPPPGRSIEDLFHESQEAKNTDPLHRLARRLMMADVHLLPCLLPSSGKPNSYLTFFERFSGSQFLTFNYDSLVELFLLRQNLWYPHDGYGLPVAAEAAPGQEHLLERSSTSFVLHLHGSLCVYTSTSTFERSPGQDIAWLEKREQSKFLFDANFIGGLFWGFQSAPRVPGFEHPEERVIAPVPNKTEGLKKEFTSAVCARAKDLVSTSTTPLVAIGYSFNPLDRSSYHPILTALESGSAQVLLVSPDASAIETRISPEYPAVTFESASRTLKSWVDAGFPGVP